MDTVNSVDIGRAPTGVSDGIEGAANHESDTRTARQNPISPNPIAQRPVAAVVRTRSTLLGRVADEVGTDLFERYFDGQALVDLHDGRLDVTVASNFLAKLLDARFTEHLRRAVGASAIEVRYRVDRAAFGGTRDPAPSPRPARQTPRAARTAARGLADAGANASRYRLETFVVGASNRLAHAAATRLADEDGPAAPLFVHGSCGLGKTHLLQGVAARFATRRPGATVRYTTAEAFTNEFINAIRQNKVEPFRKAHRRLDLLCIDDVHFLASKEATQAELLHTLDAIGLDGARLALASDEHPRDIEKLSERLVSRFLAGAVVRVDTPDPGLRLELVRHLAARKGLVADDDALRLIADRTARTVGSLGGFGGSVREIEGLLNQVEAVHRLLPDLAPAADASGEGRIGLLLVRRALGLDASPAPLIGPASRLGKPRRPLTAGEVVGEVCNSLSVDLSDYMGKGRHPRVVLARSLTAYLCRRLTTQSFPEIARAMGRTNHSTVITAYNRFERQLRAKATPLDAALAPAHAGCTLRELADDVAKRVVRAGT